MGWELRELEATRDAEYAEQREQQGMLLGHVIKTRREQELQAPFVRKLFEERADTVCARMHSVWMCTEAACSAQCKNIRELRKIACAELDGYSIDFMKPIGFDENSMTFMKIYRKSIRFEGPDQFESN